MSYFKETYSGTGEQAIIPISRNYSGSYSTTVSATATYTVEVIYIEGGDRYRADPDRADQTAGITEKIEGDILGIGLNISANTGTVTIEGNTSRKNG